MSEEERTEIEQTNEPTPMRRSRVRRKRASFRRLPPPAPSVRGLWLRASDEERAKAHRLCMTILEYWLGQATKREIAERLETSPLRVWQLSQQALSGMLVGLLKIPRSRAKLEADSALQETDTSTLRQRIAELERKLARTEDLVRVLKHLPWQTESGDGRPATKRATRKGLRKKTAQPRTETSDRAVDREEAASG